MKNMKNISQEMLNKMINNENKAKEFKLKNEMAKITEQMFKTKTEDSQDTPKIEYIKITKEELDQLKTELAETKIELEKTKEELEEVKAELENTKAEFQKQCDLANEAIEYLKEENVTLLIEKDCEIDKLNNELKEYRPRSDFIELPIYGLSVNEMYSLKRQDLQRNRRRNGNLVRNPCTRFQVRTLRQRRIQNRIQQAQEKLNLR